VIAGQSGEAAEQLVAVHADAIAKLVAEADRLRRAGDAHEARRLAVGASRLCSQVVGLWPEITRKPLS